MFKNRALFLECPSSVAIEVAPEAEFLSQFEGSRTVRSNSLKLICDDFKTNCKPASDIIKCWASSKHFLTTNLIQLIPEVSHDHGLLKMIMILGLFLFLGGHPFPFGWRRMAGQGKSGKRRWERRRTETTLYDMEMYLLKERERETVRKREMKRKWELEREMMLDIELEGQIETKKGRGMDMLLCMEMESEVETEMEGLMQREKRRGMNVLLRIL